MLVSLLVRWNCVASPPPPLSHLRRIESNWTDTTDHVFIDTTRSQPPSFKAYSVHLSSSRLPRGWSALSWLDEFNTVESDWGTEHIPHPEWSQRGASEQSRTQRLRTCSNETRQAARASTLTGTQYNPLAGKPRVSCHEFNLRSDRGAHPACMIPCSSPFGPPAFTADGATACAPGLRDGNIRDPDMFRQMPTAC